MKVIYLGHSCFLIFFKGKKLLIDPFISGNELAKKVDISGIKCHYILITHGHQDHMLDAELIANNNNATIISNHEIVSWYQSKGLNGHGMNHGGKFNFDFGTVKFVSAIHSSVLPDGSYGGNPGGFVVYDNNKSFYHAGDTALTYDMKLIPKLCPRLDFAILPIGDNFTMGIDEALMASDFIKCKKIIGCHFNTFPPINIDVSNAVKKFSLDKKKLIIPKIGGSLDL